MFDKIYLFSFESMQTKIINLLFKSIKSKNIRLNQSKSENIQN